MLHVHLEQGESARYAILHTTDRLLAQTTTVASPCSTAERELPRAPTGRLRVTLVRADDSQE